jgi:hypothetical protein
MRNKWLWGTTTLGALGTPKIGPYHHLTYQVCFVSFAAYHEPETSKARKCLGRLNMFTGKPLTLMNQQQGLTVS